MRKITSFLADPDRSQRAMKAMLQMDKIDIGGLKRAYAGE
jgi:predicted 3-demethylubiquinone-9 3-methyltransferase (glyoxalase superfamily)